ncbi:ubiquitin-like autophagy protein Apg12-domain-containing protein [Clohesyomyces aquaticus]|uniref:Ubiquitin-like protein ATG12 n=1 Tax=Clohesyomyces aquaticus TaxID=1231657 RepID=A0A1Y1ZRM3_9PLEO|nr:ubiquitin-like autophagy protein Apg12-domain-containing protein [Clohesyomyces aquaticus]
MSSTFEPSEPRIPDEEDNTADVPLTMAASVMLTNLPRDASAALKEAGVLGVGKVTIRLHPIGNAPALTQRIFKLSSTQSFATIVRFLRRKLGVKDSDSVFCYVGNVFSPSLDEGVGNLWSCFKTNDELVVGYAMAPAFG